MSIVSWKRIREVFHEAVDLPQSDRSAYLATACGDDAKLRAEVERLLAAHEGAGEFMSSPTRNDAGEPRGDDATTSEPTEGPGSRIGRYKILQLIGEGGFGSVYMAEQVEPIRRRVALKIIKLGMDTKEVIARFEAERQALAMMDHPNIARVFDAGATESGRPYFVMELVKGVPITEYCDSRQLGTRERLELFLDVCRAVDHAHAKGIIHRDLKPSNVMVTLHDGTPVAKVIDFGIAKATDHRLTEKTLFTKYGEFVGTPAYMSPEQAEMSGLEVDRRSDIYTLGALLYELLTGTPPFEPASLRSAAFVEVMRILREDDPPIPSTRVGTLGDRLEEIARRRGADPGRLAKLLKGDLDWIVMKAMEKERTRRYDSAARLVEDVERHLRHQPVSARRPGIAYRSRKFVKRRRKPILAAAAIVPLTGLAVSLAAMLGSDARANSSESVGFALRRVIESGPTPMSGALSPDGRQALFIDWPSANVATLPGLADVAIRDLETDEYTRVTRRTSVDDVYPAVPIWSRDAKWIAYMDWVEGWTHQQLRLVRPDGTDDHAILDNRQMAHAQPMAFAASGDFVVALLRGWDDVYRLGTVSLEGSLTILKTLGAQGPNAVSLSPDDRFIAYDLPTAGGSNRRDLFALAVDGSVELPIAPGPGDDQRAFWTPDGDRVVFMSDRSGQSGLWQVAWRDDGPAEEPTLVHDPLDGMMLLGLTASGSPYFHLGSSTTEVYVADLGLEGAGSLGEPSVLPETALGTNLRPAWSPDGSRIAWMSLRGPDRRSPHLVIKTLDGGEETAHPLSMIFPSGGGIGRSGRPDWSLDGRFVWVEGGDPDVPGRVSFRIDVATGEIEREEYHRDYAGVNLGKIPEFHFVDGRQSAGLRSLGVRLMGQTDFRLFAGGDAVLRPGERLIWVRNGVQEVVGPLDPDDTSTSGGQSLRPLIPPPARYPLNWSLSPQGTRLAVATVESGSEIPNVLVMVPLDGSEPIELAKLPAASSEEYGHPHFEAVRWTPDGERVIYAVQETGPEDDHDPADIWIVDGTGGTPVELGFSLSPYALGNLRFHPDGNRIAYTVPRPGSELWLAEGLPWQRTDGS